MNTGHCHLQALQKLLARRRVSHSSVLSAPSAPSGLDFLLSVASATSVLSRLKAPTAVTNFRAGLLKVFSLCPCASVNNQKLPNLAAVSLTLVAPSRRRLAEG